MASKSFGSFVIWVRRANHTYWPLFIITYGINKKVNRKQKEKIFIHSFCLSLIFSGFHHMLVTVLGTGDKEGNETDKIPILMECISSKSLSSSLSIRSITRKKVLLHSYRDIPTSANDAHALGPPVLRRGRPFCNRSLCEDAQGLDFCRA